jgi:hypothetical protein
MPVPPPLSRHAFLVIFRWRIQLRYWLLRREPKKKKRKRSQVPLLVLLRSAVGISCIAGLAAMFLSQFFWTGAGLLYGAAAILLVDLLLEPEIKTFSKISLFLVIGMECGIYEGNRDVQRLSEL